MKNLTKEEKKDYLDHPEKIEDLKLKGMEAIETHIKRWTHDVPISVNNNEIVRQFNRLWEIAESYWVFPEAEDYIILINKVYKQNI